VTQNIEFVGDGGMDAEKASGGSSEPRDDPRMDAIRWCVLALVIAACSLMLWISRFSDTLVPDMIHSIFRIDRTPRVATSAARRIRVPAETHRRRSERVCPYLSSQTSSMRQPLYMLLVIRVSSFTQGSQQEAPAG
jgi:hypothetical protein